MKTPANSLQESRNILKNILVGESVDERGQPKNSPLLADRLLNSLDSPRRIKINRLWADEAEHRVQQIKNGEVIPLLGKEVIQDIRKTLNL